jgi:hypothetical protein
MVNYANGKIYQVMAKHGGDIGDVYIGSTTKEYLSQRMDGHRNQYKQWKNGKINNVTVFGIFEKYGVENCCISLLELVNASTIDELHARERHWIQSIPCVNKAIPGRTKAEWYVDNREQISVYQSQYRVDNHEKELARQAQYRVDNREQISAQKAQYYVDNREQISSHQAKYRADNRELIKLKQSEKFQCECGCIVNRSNMSVHSKSQKHLVKLETKGQSSNAPISSYNHTQQKPILEGQCTFPH